MNVLQVCPYDLGRHGGVQRHILDLSQALYRHGHSVSIIAAGVTSSRIDGIDILTPAASRAVSIHGTRFEVSFIDRESRRILRAWLAERAFDVAHFHTLWTPALPWQVWHALRCHELRRVATFHDTPPSTMSGSMLRAVYRVASGALSRRLDAVIAVSTTPARHLRMRGDCPLEIIPPCIDLAAERAIASTRGACDAEPTIAFIGRFEPRKGVEVLLRAFALIHAKRDDVRLVLCGDGPGMTGAVALAEALGISEHVRFAGALDDQGKHAVLRRATVFCAPAIDGESFGLVLIEAMAAGVPVVAAANSGYRSVMTGIGEQALVTPDDAHALAAKLTRILDDTRLRRELADWGMRAAQGADVKTHLPELLRLYAGTSPSNGDGNG